MFSADFGTFSCEGYPQSLPREAIVRSSGAIKCQGVFFTDFRLILGGVFEHFASYEASSFEVFFGEHLDSHL